MCFIKTLMSPVQGPGHGEATEGPPRVELQERFAMARGSSQKEQRALDHIHGTVLPGSAMVLCFTERMILFN